MDRQPTFPDRSRNPGDPSGRLGRRPRLLTTLLCLTLVFSATSCAYYNTFYHAKRYYKQAEKTQREFEANPGSKDTRSANLYKQSIEKCQKVIDNYPGSKWQDDAHLLLAKAYYGRADYLNAKKTLKKFDDQLSDSELYPEAKFWRGKTAYAQAEYPEARQVWEELLAEYPDFGDREEVEFYLAESEWQGGHNEKAEEAFEAYLAAYPGGEHAADTRIDLGRVYLDNGEFEDAAMAFKEVAERGKEETDRNEARMLLGETLELQGRNEEALKLYNELAEDLDPAVYKWRMSEEELAVLRETELATAAEVAAAQAAEAAYQDSLRRAQSPPPDSLDTTQGGNNNFGQNATQTNQMSQQERAEAQRQAQRNLQRRRDMADPIDQQVGQILLREGAVIAKLGRPFEAIDVYKQVVVEFPRTPYASEAQFRIGYTYEVLLEDFDEARNAYVEVNQQGVSSFREDAARRAKNLGTVAALLAQSANDSLSAATSAAAEAKFMRAELYLFQQESPDKALAEYASIEQEFPESEHAAKAGLAIAWVTSFTLGDTAAAMEKYAETAAAFPNTEYGRRASVMVYGPEKDPEPEEFAGPSVDELRAEENLVAIALMYEAEADSTDEMPQDAPAIEQPSPAIIAAGGAVARVGAGSPSEPVPGDGSLSSAVRSTSDLVAVPDTAASVSAETNPEPAVEPTASRGDETEDRGGASAAGVAAAGAAVVGGGIAAGGGSASQEPMRMSDPNPTMAPVDAEAAPVETETAPVREQAEELAGDDEGGGVNPVAAGAAVGAAAGVAATTTDSPTGTPPASDPLSSGSPAAEGLDPLVPVGAEVGAAAGITATTTDTPTGTPPTSDPLSSGSPVARDLNPLVPVGGAATGATQVSPGSTQDEMVPGTLMEVPRGLYLDPLAVPEDGPSPVKHKNTSTAANKTPPPTSGKATTTSKPATEKKAETKEPEKKASEKAKEPEKAKQPEKKEPEKTPESKPNPGANP